MAPNSFQTSLSANFSQKYAALSNHIGVAAEQNFKKSFAQVASSVSPQVSPLVSPNVVPHSSAGLHPIPAEANKWQSHGFKIKTSELKLIREKAKQFGMTVNAYIRAKALGDDYIEKPPEWLRDILLKLYAELAGQGNNLNQIARQVNRQTLGAETAVSTIDQQRQPVFQILEKLELALSGRRPPDDY
jgi:hypothetical protein